jgi:DNA-binding response OmpR family regulator
MTNRKILIVDDDSELREALVEQLALHEEFEPVAVDNGTKGVQTAKAGQIDLVIMDVGLPDVDGREAVRILRKNGFKAPIIMLTGHTTDSDTILGLESGANDYVTKPFRFAVLLARIRAQLRQHEASEDAVFTIGPYTFRPRSKILLNSNGSKMRLTDKETGILRYLYRAGQRPVSRETLRRTSTGCGRRSRKTPPTLPSWSPKRAVTSWCHNARLPRYLRGAVRNQTEAEIRVAVSATATLAK